MQALWLGGSNDTCEFPPKLTDKLYGPLVVFPWRTLHDTQRVCFKAYRVCSLPQPKATSRNPLTRSRLLTTTPYGLSWGLSSRGLQQARSLAGVVGALQTRVITRSANFVRRLQGIASVQPLVGAILLVLFASTVVVVTFTQELIPNLVGRLEDLCWGSHVLLLSWTLGAGRRRDNRPINFLFTPRCSQSLPLRHALALQLDCPGSGSFVTGSQPIQGGTSHFTHRAQREIRISQVDHSSLHPPDIEPQKQQRTF